jgi:hypothetical protein
VSAEDSREVRSAVADLRLFNHGKSADLVEHLAAERDRLERILRATIAGLMGLDDGRTYEGDALMEHAPAEAIGQHKAWRAAEAQLAAVTAERDEAIKRAERAEWAWYKTEKERDEARVCTLREAAVVCSRIASNGPTGDYVSGQHVAGWGEGAGECHDRLLALAELMKR